MADGAMTPEEERNVLAGEFALGLLEGEEQAAAQRLLLADREFAGQVRWWNHRLACMAEVAASVEPDGSVWPAIERRLGDGGVEEFEVPAVPGRAVPGGLSGFGLLAALGGTAAAAAAITLFFVTPQSSQTMPGPIETGAPAEVRLVAQLQSEDGTISLAGLVERQAGVLSLNIAGLEPGEGAAPELWVVPADGIPRSLGQIPASGTFSRELDAQERDFLVEGSALAVTYEEIGTIPHGAPSTDILVLGGLTQV